MKDTYACGLRAGSDLKDANVYQVQTDVALVVKRCRGCSLPGLCGRDRVIRQEDEALRGVAVDGPVSTTKPRELSNSRHDPLEPLTLLSLPQEVHLGKVANVAWSESSSLNLARVEAPSW